MENKDFRNILVENIKKELSDWAQIQRELKKSRKLEFRPNDKSLQSICDEIANNRYKISLLIYYYRWLKHGLKYWAKQDIHDFWEYQSDPISYNPNGGYPKSYKDKTPYWGTNGLTYGEYINSQFYNYVTSLIDKYDIDIDEEQLEELIDYLYKNI